MKLTEVVVKALLVFAAGLTLTQASVPVAVYPYAAQKIDLAGRSL